MSRFTYCTKQKYYISLSYERKQAACEGGGGYTGRGGGWTFSRVHVLYILFASERA